jgi:hypothetical protein
MQLSGDITNQNKKEGEGNFINRSQTMRENSRKGGVLK